MYRVTKMLMISWLFLVPSLSGAQCVSENECNLVVPRLVRFGGTLKDVGGNPRTGTIGILFSIYSQADGGTPLWQETQNVHADDQGRYDVLLGANSRKGLPAT